ncbi:unnamed protein product [Bursaphelenchus xylophilus]|uniref:(pine wood nematode) hypothetical protein n=1 Tax=Bursaphelenchus xylophilus TaxID=6326 RepID=A0A1I7SDR7_BURXY|nr:unnamed protein product [Bursaphelenchus xylophilus]CAG9084379.1 unnamed protein product [Bursaphelenchus xylophilus]
MALIFFCSLLFLNPTLLAVEFSDLPVCGPYQACASRISTFPLKTQEAEADGGSGQGSGLELNEPIYDEFVTAVTPFDFDAEPESKEKRLCKCGSESEDDQTCSFEAPDNVLTIDSSLSLALCQPVKEVIHTQCYGRRHFLMIIGKLNESGEGVADVSETHVSCTCDKYLRVGIEPWTEGYVFHYRCGHD